MAAILGAVLPSGQGCALSTRLYVHDEVCEDAAGGVGKGPDGRGWPSRVR
jgi:hypothetical protein